MNAEHPTRFSEYVETVIIGAGQAGLATGHELQRRGPHAPRFVLLDDAFPKIDARTHPLLFGLLVDLDLDFVVTSERLWGTHATVPELAIYEALRSPGERGIAQFEHRWDGHQLSSVGAGALAAPGAVDG